MVKKNGNKKEKGRTKRAITIYKKIIDEWFVNGFAGADAYRKFYPSVKRTATASTNFNRIKNTPEIKEYIKKKNDEVSRIVETTHEGILKELKNWIESDITETINLTPEQVKELPIQLRRLITKFKTSTKSHYDREGTLLNIEENIELQFVSKEKAIDMINKHIGFYEKDNKQKNNFVDISGMTTDELLIRAELIKKIAND